ncbi:MAG: aminotransferase class V-fold PLP-dependent enzyme [Thalassobaculum sp.]|uniref:aminotransferase class V-fold PLP-dependent enzyme n=1 Tax=Thalassobaculum sp. TaxID=2022740 RepID=UPI0032EB1520
MSDAPAFGAPARRLFQLEDGAVYLNHGSYGATPKLVTAAQRRWQDRLEAEPSRFMEREFRPGLRVAAERLSVHLGVPGRSIAMVENATQAVNAILRSLTLKRGDEILITDQTYNAVKNTVRWVASRSGAKVTEIQLPFPAYADDSILRAFSAGLTDRTRVAIIDHVTSPTALVLPVAAMVAAAKQAGAAALVDGAHAPGMLPIDLPAIGADWYTGNCHKWLFAPKGCAFLWAADAVREALHPTVISHGYGQGFVAEFDWVGTRDASPQLALPDALAFLERLGVDRVRQHNHNLAVESGRRLAEAWGTEVGAPPGLTGSMITVRLPDGLGTTQAQGLEMRRRLLDERRIQVPINALAGGLWARVSAQVYNHAAEIDALAEAVLVEQRNAA